MVDFKKGDRVRDARHPKLKGTITEVFAAKSDLRFSRIEVRWDGTDHRQRLPRHQIDHMSVIDLLAELVNE